MAFFAIFGTVHANIAHFAERREYITIFFFSPVKRDT